MNTTLRQCPVHKRKTLHVVKGNDGLRVHICLECAADLIYEQMLKGEPNDARKTFAAVQANPSAA